MINVQLLVIGDTIIVAWVTSDLGHSEKWTSVRETYHIENIWRKLIVKMRFHLFGLRFPASMRKSVLLLGQYPNCFRTYTRGLMSASPTLFFLFLSHLSSSFLSRVLRLLLGDARLSIEFSTVLDDDAESSDVSTSGSENRPWRIIGFSIPFTPLF